MRRAFLIGIVLATTMLTLSPVSARTVTDGNDPRGQLDLRSVSFTKVAGQNGSVHLRLLWTTYDTWTTKECRQAAQIEDGCRINALLDTKGPAASRATGKGIDYAVRWTPDGCIVVEPTNEHLVTRGASHKGSTWAGCTFHRKPLTIKKKIRWYALTVWSGTPTGPLTSDVAPDHGWTSGTA